MSEPIQDSKLSQQQAKQGQLTRIAESEKTVHNYYHLKSCSVRLERLPNVPSSTAQSARYIIENETADENCNSEQKIHVIKPCVVRIENPKFDVFACDHCGHCTTTISALEAHLRDEVAERKRRMLQEIAPNNSNQNQN